MRTISRLLLVFTTSLIILSGGCLNKAEVSHVTKQSQKILVPGTSKGALERKGVIAQTKNVSTKRVISKNKKRLAEAQAANTAISKDKPRFEDVTIEKLPNFNRPLSKLIKIRVYIESIYS